MQYTVPYTMYNVHCKMYNAQCTMYVFIIDKIIVTIANNSYLYDNDIDYKFTTCY